MTDLKLAILIYVQCLQLWTVDAMVHLHVYRPNSMSLASSVPDSRIHGGSNRTHVT